MACIRNLYISFYFDLFFTWSVFISDFGGVAFELKSLFIY